MSKVEQSRAHQKYYRNLSSRKACATLVQLRSGHCALNSYLHRFGKADSKCGYGNETVQHFLLECCLFRDERKKLRKEVGTGRIKVAWLLGSRSMASHILEYTTTCMESGPNFHFGLREVRAPLLLAEFYIRTTCLRPIPNRVIGTLQTSK